MAWTGTATIEQITDSLVRVTGLSLAGAASGTISLADGAGDEVLPAGFKPSTYGSVTRIDAIQISMVPVTTITTLVPIMVVKSGADTDAAFLITFTNTTAATTSALQEIWIRWH